MLLSLFLIAVLFHNALPFVGFGFLDNAIMIAAVSGFRYEVTKFNLTGITCPPFVVTLSLDEHLTLLFSLLQGTQIELSIGVTLGISTMAGKNM